MTRSLLIIAIVGSCIVPIVGRAQASLSDSATYRLTVRPHTMSIGTQNPAAGTYPLDSVPDVLVTVPPQCAGAHQCPLLVQLPGGGGTAQWVTKWSTPFANTYGVLLLAPTTYEPTLIDAALRETLRRFAVNPDHIAIGGRCASGPAAVALGINNPDVFSRVASVSGGIPDLAGLDPHNTTTQFYIADGMNEPDDSTFAVIERLRRAGHPVEWVTEIRSHEPQPEEYDILGMWLRDSWATPNPTARPSPRRLPEPLPVLTSQAMTQLTTFWTHFFQEPDLIRTTARRAYDRLTVVPMGSAQPWTLMADMPALATHVPAVAADLLAAGLTAEQHDAYRLALLSALIAHHMPGVLTAAGAQSVLAQNVVFLDTHRDELNALAWGGVTKSGQMWEDDGVLGGFPQWNGQPEDIRAVGPMGIWRTP